MRKLIYIVPLLVTAAIWSQEIRFKTHFVKKHGANVTTTQMDTISGRATDGSRITGAAAVLNGTRADTLWYLTSTGTDTSRVYLLWAGSVQFHITLDDTSTADDSAGTTLKIYGAPKKQFREQIPAYAEFVFIDSVNFNPGTTSSGVTADDDVPTTGVNGQGTYTYVYTYAGSNRPGYDYFYVTLNGLSGTNKVLSAVSNVLSVSFAW